MDLQTTILQVAVGTTTTGKQKFTVSCGDGQDRTVWEASLANGINAYAGSGQAITIRENVSTNTGRNGQTYTNRTIKAFAPPGQSLPPEQPGGGSGNTNGGFQRGGGAGGRGGMSPEDKTRIAKMGAQGSASTLVAALFTGAGPEAYEQAVEMMDLLTKKLYKDARSHETPGGGVQEQQGVTVLQPGGALPVTGAAVTPQEIAAAVPGVQVGAQVLAPGGATDAAAAADVQAQNAVEQGDSTIEWN